MIDVPLPQSHVFSLSAAPGEAVLQALRQCPGIVMAKPSPDGRRLELRYDLRLTGLKELERMLPALGVRLSQGLMARLSRRWAAFQEANLRSHAAIRHKCCNSLDAD
ncbi:MAG TPA: hypothetical protein VM661_07265 [Candidatus Sulfotelmatobacter sp.]|jgi:hypothetical protein|nr:hypothetical protein [Candidatus Sulfotelmatobacter sp.]